MLDNTLLSPPYGHRFHSILHGTQSTNAVWDTVLVKVDDYTVVPTLGSIVPYWHLVLPRKPCTNLREHLSRKGSGNLDEMLKLIATKHPSRRVLWFEHGAIQHGSTVGCGVDQAHLHVILDTPFGFSEFRSAAEREFSDWQVTSTTDVYSRIAQGIEYYAFGDLESAHSVSANGKQRSQFFRRIVADLVGRPDQWNYREYPHLGQVSQTVRIWGEH